MPITTSLFAFLAIELRAAASFNEHDSVSGSELKAGALEYGYLFNYHSLAISS